MITNIKYINFTDKHNGIYTAFYEFQKKFLFNCIKNGNNKINISCIDTFEYPVNWTAPGKHINEFITSQIEKRENDTLYIFNSLDYYFITVNITRENINNFNKFIELKNYIFIHFEVYINDNLEQIGYPEYNCNLIANGLIGDDRKKFICNFYKNAKYVILQSYKNIEYLKKYYNGENIIYFPCLGYSKVNNFIPIQQKNKEIDLLFYGTRDGSTPHRNNMIEKLIKYTDQNNINFVYDKFLYGDDKDNMLSKSKIVLHLPIKLESKIAPAWCKIMELTCKKIFFIIEENDEIYNADMQDIIIFYKHNDFTDLINKIEYYLNNLQQKWIVIERCYELVKTKYNMDEFIKNLIN